MLDWLKSWFGKDGKVVIHIDSVVFPAMECHCPRPPVAPATPVTLLRGDTVMSIKYPVNVPASPSADVVKTNIVVTVEGEPSTTIELLGNGGDSFITVPNGSNGSVVATYVDGANNVSSPTPAAIWTNASDTTPPESGATAPTLGAGETAP